MLIPAIAPVRNWLDAQGVYHEEPSYQQPRFHCDSCGKEQFIPDHGYMPHYGSTTLLEPSRPVGWIIVSVISDTAGVAGTMWHFCSVACISQYRDWEDVL